MLVVVTASQGTIPKSREGISLRVQSLRLARGLRTKEQMPVLDCEEKQEPVDQAKKLLEVAGLGDLTSAEGVSETVVHPMLQEAVAELAEGCGDAQAEMGAGTFTGLKTLGPPGFENTFCRGAIVRRDTADMKEQPEC